MTACDLEKTFSCDETVEITSDMHCLFHMYVHNITFGMLHHVSGINSLYLFVNLILVPAVV